ncbi:MAG: radical SAM protein [Clostridia bacterium]|nr:radical SAM protein [Clostridia bacterium]
MSLKISSDSLTGFHIDNSIEFAKFASPIMISLDVTNRCNFRCLHCFNESDANGKSAEFTDEEILDIAKQMRDMNPMMVCLCGGETTCRKNLLDIIHILSSGGSIVSMVSNGYLINDSYAKKLKEANINFVQISVDGINKYQHDTFRQKCGAFDHAINAIKELKKQDLHVATSLVPNKMNWNHISEYIEMCKSLHVDEIRIMPYIPIGRGSKVGKKLLLEPDEYAYFQTILYEYQITQSDIRITWGDPLDHLVRMPNNTINGMSTFSFDIRSNGDIGITPYFPFVFGNIRRHSLSDYWENGLNTVWTRPEVMRRISKIKNVYDIGKEIEPINIDLIEGGKI